MFKTRKIEKVLSMICVICMLISVFSSGAVSFAEDDSAVEDAKVEQNKEVDINDEISENTKGRDESEDMEGAPEDRMDIESQAGDGAKDADATTVEEYEGNSHPEDENINDSSSDSAKSSNEEYTVNYNEKSVNDQTAKNGIDESSVSEEYQENNAVESETISGDVGQKEQINKVRQTRSATSNDLSDFLTDVIIDAPVDDDGNYVINPNDPYEITFMFGENESFQFEDEGVLVYDLPEGLITNNIGSTAFSLTIVDENGTATINDNMFEVVDGQLRIRFNQDDPNFERLKAMPNVNFNVTISSYFDESSGEIVFSENIVKDFVYEETSDITIQKRVIYDKDNDTANYELIISSEGLNENVVIEDMITGTALTFNQDVVVESNINGALSVTPNYESVDNGFSVSIPQMTHGEVVTIRYSATVDNTKISSNGTVEQTNNTARVTSDQVPDGKEVSANFAGQADFQRVAKRPEGEMVQVGENLYEQTWKVRVNEDHKMPMGGANIDDWILATSRPFMQFTGEGLTINVTFENGETEMRNVPWSDLYLWQNNDGIWGWRYTAPDSDGKASYEIICKTLIDSNGALGDLTLINGAQVYGSYDEGKVSVGQIGENHFGIEKDAVGTTSTESEWQLKVEVPGSGLPEMHVVDDLPKLDYGGQTYIDYYISDSMRVEGLLDGESWKLTFDSTNRSFTVTFYQTETQTDTNKGILPTPDGQPREIVISYKTSVNQDWLNLASENGYASSQLYRHRNYACVWSGSYRTETVNDSVIPVKPDLIKDFVERSAVEIDGVTYPVFRYELALLGPTEDGIVIQDSFNTEYLKLYEDDGLRIRGWSNSTTANENGTVSAVDTTDGVDITVDSFPKQSDGSFYSYYTISYSLIVKDEEALATLNDNAASSQNGINLENTATWDSLESNKIVNYTYFPYVDKELITRPTAENGYVAEFEVIINKYAEDLDPAADTLTIQDVLSPNLRFIPDSLTITPEDDSITVQHDSETNTLTFDEVPDETTFVIRYQARVLGNGNVTYSNTVKFGKFEKNVEEVATIESSGGGTGSNPSITLVKRDSEMLTKTLAGGTFQLFYMENENQIPVRDREGENVYFTTDGEGKVLIIGNLQNYGWTLWKDRTYCLVETEAPVGYELNDEPIYFVLTEHPSSQIEFDISGDQLSVKNDPIKISVPVTKNWNGPVGADEVVVHLLADGTDTGKTLTLTASGEWSGSFTDLRKYDDAGSEIQYSVEEDPIDNYSTSYDGSAENGFTITNSSTETIEIPVEKQWIGPAAESVTIRLFADGLEQENIVLSEDNDWKYVFTDLDKYDHNDGHEINYNIQEDIIPGYDPKVIDAFEEGVTFINTNVETIDIPVEKKWIGPEQDSVTVNLIADGEEVDSVVLTDEDDWKYTFKGLLRYDGKDGHEIEYTIEELEVDDYETEISGDSNGYTVTNTNTETIDIPVEKKWVGPELDYVTVNLLSDGEVLCDADLNKDNDWQYTFTDLPKYDGTDGHKIDYTISEDSVENYSSEISGNADEGFVVTNTNVETVSVEGIKVWDDNDDQDGIRPESITVRLMANGIEIGNRTVSEDDDWKWSFDDLPKYDNGEEISYDISEDDVDGYVSEITQDVESQYVITNYHEPGMIDISVNKIWKDYNDKLGKRPDSITIRLLADGESTGDSIILNEDNGWSGSFSYLDKYRDDKLITYSISEDVVKGYTSSIKGSAEDGFTVTNKVITGAPKTGDGTNVIKYFCLILISVMGIICMLAKPKRRKAKVNK